VIIDPGIKVDQSYKPYNDGISKGIFVKVSSPAVLMSVHTYSMCSVVYVYCVISVSSCMAVQHVCV